LPGFHLFSHGHRLAVTIMNRTPQLILGAFLAFAAAWLGVVAYSYVTLGRLEPKLDEASGAVSPPTISGLAVAGQRVYAANGCVYCHTQVVRPSYLSGDIEKKLGPRRTVARDFVREQPVFTGTLRIGPDLANYGLRAPSPVEIYRRLFEPSQVTPSTLMPSFRSLYKVVKISGEPSAEAVTGLTGPHAPRPGYEVIPTEEAKVLVSYLLSLKRDYPLPEAPPEPQQ
jgi:cytochrome c oxidase cbb3-type subunit II